MVRRTPNGFEQFMTWLHKAFFALLYTYSIVSCHFISKCFWNCYKIYAGNFR